MATSEDIDLPDMTNVGHMARPPGTEHRLQFYWIIRRGSESCHGYTPQSDLHNVVNSFFHSADDLFPESSPLQAIHVPPAGVIAQHINDVTSWAETAPVNTEMVLRLEKTRFLLISRQEE